MSKHKKWKGLRLLLSNTAWITCKVNTFSPQGYPRVVLILKSAENYLQKLNF